MPAIIAAPVRTRNNAAAISDADLETYITLMLEAYEQDENSMVTVDDSERVGYEAAYARGERIRIALKKRTNLTFKVQVVSYKVNPDDDRNTATYAAGVRVRKS